MSLQNAIEIAEANLRDAKLDWEDFCREKDELEEPVDENDTEVTVQHSVMEALIVAAKAEAARTPRHGRFQLDLASLTHVALDQERPHLLEWIGRHRGQERRIDRLLADLGRAGLKDRNLDALIDDALFRGGAGREQQQGQGDEQEPHSAAS